MRTLMLSVQCLACGGSTLVSFFIILLLVSRMMPALSLSVHIGLATSEKMNNAT
jgi:hypothetical protein